MRPLNLDNKVPTRKASVSKKRESSVKQIKSEDYVSSKKRPELSKVKKSKFEKPKPVRTSNLPVSQLPFEYGDPSEMSAIVHGPIAIYNMGQRFDIGDYVAVRGVEHPEYFGIITGFEVRDSKKCFWMRWLIPKPGRLSAFRLRDSPLTINDFNETSSDIVTCEPVDAIKYVFDSVPSYQITNPKRQAANVNPSSRSISPINFECGKLSATQSINDDINSNILDSTDSMNNSLNAGAGSNALRDFSHNNRKALSHSQFAMSSSLYPSATLSDLSTPVESEVGSEMNSSHSFSTLMPLMSKNSGMPSHSG